jgi:hypothetical protein
MPEVCPATYIMKWRRSSRVGGRAGVCERIMVGRGREAARVAMVVSPAECDGA